MSSPIVIAPDGHAVQLQLGIAEIRPRHPVPHPRRDHPQRTAVRERERRPARDRRPLLLNGQFGFAGPSRRRPGRFRSGPGLCVPGFHWVDVEVFRLKDAYICLLNVHAQAPICKGARAIFRRRDGKNGRYFVFRACFSRQAGYIRQIFVCVSAPKHQPQIRKGSAK